MSPPRDYGPIQLADHLGLAAWQFARARAAALVPGPDRPDQRWSGAVVADITTRVDSIRAAVGTGSCGRGRGQPAIGGRPGREEARPSRSAAPRAASHRAWL